MAHLVRQKTTHHVDAAGKRVRPGTRGAKKVVTVAKKWYGAGVPGMGKKRVPLAADKRVAQKMLDYLVTAAERGEAGLSSMAEATALLEPLLAEFETTVGRKSKAKHVATVMRNVRRVLAGCRLKAVADLRAADLSTRVETFVWSLTKAEGGPLEAPSAAYVGKHARQFTRWLWRKRKLLAADPLAGMDLPSQETVDKRRALSADELGKLIDAATASAKRFRKLTGTDRAALYALAATTGFRVSELASLTAASLAADSDPPTVYLEAEHAKNGKEATMPLSPGVVKLLRPILAHRTAGPLWPGTWHERAAKMFRGDLAAAGVPVLVDGEHADFHALRHTFTTMIGRTAPPKVVQELARHSTPLLTVGRYSHAELSEKAAAVATIRLPGDEPAANPLAALTRPQLEAVAAAALALAGVVLFTPPLTPNLDTGRDRVIPTETPATGGGGKGKRRKP